MSATQQKERETIKAWFEQELSKEEADQAARRFRDLERRIEKRLQSRRDTPVDPTDKKH